MKAEQLIKDYTRKCSNELCAVEDKYGKKVISYHEWLTPEQALSAVQIEREEMIEQICEWLKENASNYASTAAYSTVVNYDEEFLVEDFKKYMEGKDEVHKM